MIKTKIIIAGIGGVGGYFGGVLAKYYYESNKVEINFLARGQHLKEIQKNGLKVIKGKNEFISKPNIATENPTEIGMADLILVSTKSYDLEKVMHQLKPCINNDTIILPLLNGVESKAKIKSIYPNNLVLDGCVYIVSRLKQPGLIENSGNIQKLYFGLDNYTNENLLKFEKIFKDAGIEATLSQNISPIIWEKYIFLSAIATSTSFYDKCIGEVLSDNEAFETTKLLIEEIKSVAIANNIKIPGNITEKTLNKLSSVPYETMTSMHSDFRNKRSHNELQTLAGFVIKQGEIYNISTATYSKLNAALQKKTGS